MIYKINIRLHCTAQNLEFQKQKFQCFCCNSLKVNFKNSFIAKLLNMLCSMLMIFYRKFTRIIYVQKMKIRWVFAQLFAKFFFEICEKFLKFLKPGPNKLFILQFVIPFASLIRGRTPQRARAFEAYHSPQPSPTEMSFMAPPAGFATSQTAALIARAWARS